MAEGPPFLEMEQYHVSNSEAKRIVIRYLQDDGMKSPKGGWERLKLTFGPNQQQTTFSELTKIVRETGVMPVIQGNIDRADSIFGGTFGISTPTMALGQVTSQYAGYSKTMIPPMTNQPVESELSEDIMYYREESCLWSDEYDFTFCTRNYRAYLIACVALVDAFINRHILMYKHQGLNSPDFELLQKTSRLEDRLDLFIKISTGKDITAINGGDEWIHFKNIRRLRNEMTHVNAPSLGYSIGEFAEHFNYVRKGIGGLLYKIRALQGRPTLGFIERLKTAPIIYFNEITHKADGNHIVKRRK